MNQLTTAQLDEIEARAGKARIAKGYYRTAPAVSASLDDIPALCAAVRNLVAENERADRILRSSAPADCQAVSPVGTVQNYIAQLEHECAALREQLAEANKERDNALVRAVEDQDEHSAQRAKLVQELEAARAHVAVITNTDTHKRASPIVTYDAPYDKDCYYCRNQYYHPDSAHYAEIEMSKRLKPVDAETGETRDE